MKNKKTLSQKIIEYIIILGVLTIPFMYSFFYLKAYWNPYGKGNIDNLPVAVVNNDTGDKGEELINNIKNSKKLKLSVINNEDASKGLNEGDYYAVINIPSNFTDSINSVGEKNKIHPTITYSPNQKSNYLSSQIINTVVNVVEKNFDNTINSEVVGKLINNLEDMPSQLNTINDAVNQVNDGTNKINNGSSKLNDGLNTLNTNYNTFNNGIYDLKSGVNLLNANMSGLSTVQDKVEELTTGTNGLTTGSNNFTAGLNNYVTGVNSTLDYSNMMATYIINTTDCTNSANYQICAVANGLLTSNPNYGGLNSINYLKTSGNTLKTSNETLNNGMNQLNNNISGFILLSNNLTELQTGVNKINNGVNTLYNNSNLIKTGINDLYTGSKELSNGTQTLSNITNTFSKTLDNKVNDASSSVDKLNGLKEYSKNPVTIKTEEVNKIESYGTAFAPLFISIALWVGSLMFYIVLYFDKHHRFGILDEDAKGNVKRTLAFHGLATVSGVLLALLLQLLLDFNITNYLLYYLVIILVANTFLSIIQFLIGNFKDIGKFIALIILVLQLAASGGTFPIETVTSGFRCLNKFLPMTYTIKLIKETIIVVEKSLLTKNLVIVIMIFMVFFIINLIVDIIRDKKIKTTN